MKKLRALLLSVILVGLSSQLYAQQVTPVNPQDSLALVTIYNNTNGSRWVRGWDLGSPASTWSGVDINGNGQVIALSLAENNLRGTFDGYDPRTQLTALSTVELTDNFLTAISLPPSVSFLAVSLNRLSLSDVSVFIQTPPNPNFTLTPQKSFGPDVKASAILGDSVELVVEEDTTPAGPGAAGNNYLWSKIDANGGATIIQRGPSNILSIPAVAYTDSGQYTVQLEHGQSPNFGYTRAVNIRLIVSPGNESHESARDNTGKLRAILRLDPNMTTLRRERVRRRMEELGITPITGEGCLCDEFSLYHFPESFQDSLGDQVVGPVSLLTSACGEVEAVGGGSDNVQLGYDYLVDPSPGIGAGPDLNIRLETSLDMSNLAPVKVAVIDLGIDKDHPDLKGHFSTDPSKIACMSDNQAQGYNFYADDDNPYDIQGSSSHGTHVAGIITGFIPELPIELISIQVGKNGNDTRIFDLACGIRYAALEEADLINISMGYKGPKSELLGMVIASLQTSVAKTQIIASTGNNGDDLKTDPFWPAAFAESYPQLILAVGAMDENYTSLAATSNFSDFIAKIAAPGTNIRSTVNGGSYGIMSGTSMAAPFVTAVLSHPISVAKAQSPGAPAAVNLDASSKNPDYSIVEAGIANKIDDNRKLKVLIDDCNNVPLAREDAYLVANGQSLSFDVRLNDCPSTGLLPTITQALDPADGEAIVNADGTISFSPQASDKEVSFTYQICSASSVCSEAVVKIKIGTDTPTANYWWWIILILIIMFILAYFVLRRSP
ncbi:MAG: S8 family serine peptidase [Bacteroidia bacterium]|nr:S8 family serine peptidase [Bacteroidia bacterium]